MDKDILKKLNKATDRQVILGVSLFVALYFAAVIFSKVLS